MIVNPKGRMENLLNKIIFIIFAFLFFKLYSWLYNYITHSIGITGDLFRYFSFLFLIIVILPAAIISSSILLGYIKINYK